MTSQIYAFGAGDSAPPPGKEIVGGKGYGLMVMDSLGVPVPSGFILPCALSVEFHTPKANKSDEKAFHAMIAKMVDAGLANMKGARGKLPLLSVRSGARVSMPGMMDTILNVGLTSKTFPLWEKRLGLRTALDCQRRLIQMYASVAMHVPLHHFEAQLEAAKIAAGVEKDSDLGVEELARLVSRYQSIVVEVSGHPMPDDVYAQVLGAVYAVFDSWNNPRAQEYRKIHDIPVTWGTAVIVQSMVFGNMNDESATGVLFTRNPSTGVPGVMGNYLVNAQGEDVVAGIRTPEPLSTLPDWNESAAKELEAYAHKLEAHFRDMQDIEFTIQDGKVYLLQTRDGKRASLAAFRVAHDLVKDGVITKEEAVGRVDAEQLFNVMSDRVSAAFKQKPHLTGLAAGGGVAQGVAVFTAQDAINCKVPCILVTKDTDPNDVAGMHASKGILTAIGGDTSHAAVVARGMNKACVVGATELEFPLGGAPDGYINGALAVSEGDLVTVDGSTGNVWFKTPVPLDKGEASPLVREVVSWASTAPTSSRLELHPKMALKDIMHAVEDTLGSVIYVDTAAIESHNHGIEGIREIMENLGSVLSATDERTVVVELSCRVDHYSCADSCFDIMFGIDKEQAGIEVIKEKMRGMAWPKFLRERTTIVANGREGITSWAIKHGFAVSIDVQTFADLLNAQGPVSVSPVVMGSVFGGQEAYLQAIKAVESLNGVPLPSPIAPPTYWYEAFASKPVSTKEAP